MIAILALKSNVEDKTREIGDSLLGLLGEDTIVRLADGGKTTVAEVAGVEVKVSRRDHSIPSELLEGPLEAAWYWPEAQEHLSAHRSHLVVICQKSSDQDEGSADVEGEAEKDVPAAGVSEIEEVTTPPRLDASEISHAVQRSLLLTRVTQVLGKAFGAIGVYWDSSTSLHSWGAFEESCNSMTPDRLPLRIWIDFRLWEATDGTRGLVTRGLSTLGQREIEVIGSTSSAEQVRAWSYTVAHFCLEQSKVLEHGQAVGVSATEWVRAWVVESRLEPGTWATWLDLEAEE